MLSIIICSGNPEMLRNVSLSIQQTVGIPFEIIAIDNVNGKYGICKAYNIGAAKAKYDHLCFMHEDIHFETRNWGINVLNHLQDKSVGLIGVLGADPKLKIPSFKTNFNLKVEANLIAYSNSVPIPTFTTVDPHDRSIIKQVTAVDGIWMCTRKDVFKKFQFDDITLTGFHGYDIDFSLQVFQEYRVCVVFDVLMHHYSGGNPDRKHLQEKLKLNRKWRKKTPLSFRNYTKKELSSFHWAAMHSFTEHLFTLQYKKAYIIRLFCYFSLNKFFKLRPFLAVLKKIILTKQNRSCPNK
jgi:GT2 family glycosyltransferase